MVIYLHGFASSAQSGKATYLSARLRARGEEVVTPDLNLPDFSTLTVTRMLEQTHAILERAAEPVSVASEVAAPEVAGTPIDSEAALEGAGTRVDSEVALEAVGMPIDSEVAAAEGPGTRVDSEATLGAGGEVAGETRED